MGLLVLGISGSRLDGHGSDGIPASARHGLVSPKSGSVSLLLCRWEGRQHPAVAPAGKLLVCRCSHGDGKKAVWAFRIGGWGLIAKGAGRRVSGVAAAGFLSPRQHPFCQRSRLPPGETPAVVFLVVDEGGTERRSAGACGAIRAAGRLHRL